MSSKIMPKIVLILVLAIALSMTSIVAFAEPVPLANEETSTNDVNIMHITDIHYIPAYYCYLGDLVENDFATKIKGDPKLMLESYAILEATTRMIIDANKKDPIDYVLLTGDITSNGEKQSLIDVANAMRKMQNEVRASGNANFQVLVTPGNHDVFNNRHASFYNTPDGKKLPASIASRAEFVKIFAGLGYPNLTDAEAKSFYSAEEWNVDATKHLPYHTEVDGQAFVNSTNRADLRFEYFVEETGWPQDDLGGLTYTCYDDVNKLTVTGFDTTLSVKNDQRTEGEFTRENIDWYCSKDFGDYTQIIMGHHNIFNHHPKQEEYTQAFVTYGWEEVAERLTSHGARYCFTGHFHANDVNNYVSFNNNVLYDIETGATISYGAGIRLVTIREYADGQQDLMSVLMPMDTADFTYLVENGYMPKGYDDCFRDKANNIIDIQKYIDAKLFTPYLENMVHSFIGPLKINKMIDDLGVKKIEAGPIKIEIDLTEIVKVLIGEINTKVLSDYTYGGEVPSLKLEENKLIGYVHELLMGAIKTEIASGGHTFDELVLYAYGNHLMGGEPACEADMPKWVQEAVAGFRSGEMMSKVIDVLLFDKGGLYDVIDELARTPLDLTKCTNSLDAINMVVDALGVEVDTSKVVLNTLVMDVLNTDLIKGMGINLNLKGATLMEAVDNYLDTYLTDGMKKGIGGILCDIAVSFATDGDSYDGTFNEHVLFKVNKEDAHSFMGTGKAKIEATRENGRLPSKLTVTYGDDPSTKVNFVWFTSQFVPHGDMQYKVAGTDKWTTIDATSEILPYSFPIMNFGIFSSYIDKNIARHNARLTGLEAGTKYEYRVGDSTRDVWSPIGTFETAAKSGAFDVAIFTDIQGMENIPYENALKTLTASTSLFENGANFTINLGDLVNNGKNSDAWACALDTLAPYWATNVQVPVIGNSEAKVYESGKVKPRKKAVNVDVKKMTYETYNFYYDRGSVKKGSTYYSFDYQGVHFTVMDTTDVDKKTGNISSKQENWLKSDLSTTTSAHKVVLMHNGIYTAGPHAGDRNTIAMREQLSPIFYANKVELVFQGNDGTYSETKALNDKGEVVEDGVKYITMGTLGDNSYKYNNEANIPMEVGDKLHAPSLQGPTIGRLVYDGTKLDYQGYIYDNDSFVKVEDFDATAKPEVEDEAKHNLTWLWITLGIVGVIIVLLIVGVVLCKNKKTVKKIETHNDAEEEPQDNEDKE